MNQKLISAAIFAAILSTPAMACTDWKAIAAFDAINNANDTRELATPHNKDDTVMVTVAHLHMQDVEDDRKAALADTCQENAR